MIFSTTFYKINCYMHTSYRWAIPVAHTHTMPEVGHDFFIFFVQNTKIALKIINWLASFYFFLCAIKWLISNFQIRILCQLIGPFPYKLDRHWEDYCWIVLSSDAEKCRRFCNKFVLSLFALFVREFLTCSGFADSVTERKKYEYCVCKYCVTIIDFFKN